jgi:hypothetical protein
MVAVSSGAIRCWSTHARLIRILCIANGVGYRACRRGDLNSYSTGEGGLIIGPELWLPAA